MSAGQLWKRRGISRAYYTSADLHAASEESGLAAPHQTQENLNLNSDEELPEENVPATAPGARPLHTGRYLSGALGREQPYAYFLPDDPDGGEASSQRRYPLLVLLHGRTGSYTDWPTKTRIARVVAAYPLVVVFPEGDEGWYTNAADGGTRYEDDLLQDLLPHIQATLPVQPPGKAWAIGGLSMGGYGAVKTALKHPHLFSAAVSHSGAFEQVRNSKPHSVFGDPDTHAALRHAEDVFALVEQAMCRYPTERPRLSLDCGLQDDFLEINRRFDAHLTFLGYPHTYREMPGYHTWPYWDRAFRTSLPEIARALGATK